MCNRKAIPHAGQAQPSVYLPHHHPPTRACVQFFALRGERPSLPSALVFSVDYSWGAVKGESIHELAVVILPAFSLFAATADSRYQRCFNTNVPFQGALPVP